MKEGLSASVCLFVLLRVNVFVSSEEERGDLKTKRLCFIHPSTFQAKYAMMTFVSGIFVFGLK